MRSLLALTALLAAASPAAGQEPMPPENRILATETVDLYLETAENLVAVFRTLIELDVYEPEAGDKFDAACQQMFVSRAAVAFYLEELAKAAEKNALPARDAADLPAAQAWFRVEDLAFARFCASSIVRDHNDLAAATIALRQTMTLAKDATREWRAVYLGWDRVVGNANGWGMALGEFLESSRSSAEIMDDPVFKRSLASFRQAIEEYDRLRPMVERTVRAMLYREVLWKAFLAQLGTRDWGTYDDEAADLAAALKDAPSLAGEVAAATEIMDRQYAAFADLHALLEGSVKIMAEGSMWYDEVQHVDMRSWHSHIQTLADTSTAMRGMLRDVESWAQQQ